MNEVERQEHECHNKGKLQNAQAQVAKGTDGVVNYKSEHGLKVHFVVFVGESPGHHD